jgi:hypothetical protein
MRSIFFIGFALSTLVVSSCTGSDDLGRDRSVATERPIVGVHQQSLAGIPTNSDTWWAGGVVPVCFVNRTGMPSADFADAGAKIFGALNDTWGSVGTIAFTGGGTCSTPLPGNSTMKLSLEHKFVRSDGGIDSADCNNDGACFRDNCRICIVDPIDYLPISVHEVGHGLGMAHEHQRAVLDEDGNLVYGADGGLQWEEALCATEQAREDGRLPDGGVFPGQRFAEYSFHLTRFDPTSIMNYCGQSGGRVRGDYSLTALDRLGAEILHPSSFERSAVLTSATFQQGDGSVVCRPELDITTDWLRDGADPLVFGGAPPSLAGLGIHWKVDNVTATFGVTFPVLLLGNYSGGTHAVSGIYTDIYGRASSVQELTLPDCNIMDSEAHTSLLAALL